MKIAFTSNGCQTSFGKVREIIVANPNLEEVEKPEEADVLMVNFCAISADNLNGWGKFRDKMLSYKRSNPNLKILAGGCIEGLSEKKDLSFANAVYHHQEEAEAFQKFLQLPENPALAPNVMFGLISVVIAQGCNRRCAFCKTNYLNYQKVTSRPEEEILTMVRQAVAQGYCQVSYTAENTTEYGIDIGTNLISLLQKTFAIDGVRYVDVFGLCLDEVNENLLQALKHPKIRRLQLEVQSLNDMIRRSMHLAKSKDEVLFILDELADKAIVSNMMTEFPGHSPKEFDREMKLAVQHKLYYLTYDPYDDTEGVPAHRFYTPAQQGESDYYMSAFFKAISPLRQAVVDEMMAAGEIEAFVTKKNGRKVTLHATNWTVQVEARDRDDRVKAGDIVKVRVTGLRSPMPANVRNAMLAMTPVNERIQKEKLIDMMRYFDPVTQELSVTGDLI